MHIKKSIHNVAVMGVGVVLILALFLFHYAVSQAGEKYREKVTGNVIQISEGEGPFVMIDEDGSPDQEQLPQGPPETPLSETLQCWADAGVTKTDLSIIGNLLEHAQCQQEREATEITVKKEKECVVIDSDNKIVTRLCDPSQDGAPRMSIELPGSEGLYVPEIPKQKNYVPWFLFIVFGFSVLVVSREHSFAFGFKEKDDRQKQEEEKKVEYIEAAPLFSDKPLTSDIHDLEKKHRKLLAEYASERQSFVSIAILPEEITIMIKEFNTKTREIYVAIKRNDASAARKGYLDLFPLYTRLYNALKEERKQELQEVIAYLHDQITILEKSSTITSLIEEAYRQAEAHKVSGKQGKEKKTVEKLQKEIRKLKELLHEKKK